MKSKQNDFKLLKYVLKVRHYLYLMGFFERDIVELKTHKEKVDFHNLCLKRLKYFILSTGLILALILFFQGQSSYEKHLFLNIVNKVNQKENVDRNTHGFEVFFTEISTQRFQLNVLANKKDYYFNLGENHYFICQKNSKHKCKIHHLE